MSLPNTFLLIFIYPQIYCSILLFSHSVMSDSFCDWTVAHQASLYMGFPKQEYWRGLPFPSLGDLPHSGIELASPALAGGFFTAEPPGKYHTALWPISKKDNPNFVNNCIQLQMQNFWDLPSIFS